MRLSQLALVVSFSVFAQTSLAEQTPAPVITSVVNAEVRAMNAQLDQLEQRLAESERLRGELSAQLEGSQAEQENAQLTRLRQDNQRLEGLYREDPGTISVRLLEVSRANREQAVSQVAAARAEVQRAQEQEGGSAEDNALLRSAATALSKAELDLANTQIRARSAGLITDLRQRARVSFHQQGAKLFGNLLTLLGRGFAPWAPHNQLGHSSKVHIGHYFLVNQGIQLLGVSQQLLLARLDLGQHLIAELFNKLIGRYILRQRWLRNQAKTQSGGCNPLKQLVHCNIHDSSKTCVVSLKTQYIPRG